MMVIPKVLELYYISLENVININYPLSFYVINFTLILYINGTCKEE